MNIKQLNWELVVFVNHDLRRVLEQISRNEKGFVVVVDNELKIAGTITDGDIRRYISSTEFFDLTTEVSHLLNKNFTCLKATERNVEIENQLIKKFKFIPIVDELGRLQEILQDDKLEFRIGDNIIDDNSACYIIAEIGNNHNGSVELAKQMVDLAVEAGADCVKFQMRNMKDLFRLRNDESEDLGAQYTFDLLDRFQLSNEELFSVFDYCKVKGLKPLCTPWDKASIEELEKYGVEFYKVASADLTNHILIKRLIKTGKPLILSTGMSTDAEIGLTAKLLNDARHPFMFLHCNSTYPAPFDEIKLTYMEKLKELTKRQVGYSGHERGVAVSIAAVALGAKVIERHFTIDRSMEGNDHKVSLLPGEFKQLVKGIREVEAAMAPSFSRRLSQGELMNREVLGKSIYITKAIKKEQIFTREHFAITSPGKGMRPYKIDELIGQHAPKDYKINEFIFENDFEDDSLNQRNAWTFPLKHGIPVRYHDYKALYTEASFDCVEFHLSYQDLHLDISKYIEANQEVQLVVHCPELYPNDHILNLVADDKGYRQKSVAYLEQTISHIHDLMAYFPATKKPCLITNVGGFSENSFLPAEWRTEKYELLEDELKHFDNSCVEIIPQTMPPFPWHFGGQRFHNLFVDPDEIISHCKKYHRRVCLDISHTKLAANVLKLSFGRVLTDLAPFTAHLHIADALERSGEGLQIGEGDIPFSDIWPQIKKQFIHSSFVPEVWQGHTNNGVGFWRAFNKLKEFK
jgi:sialic acid synthase SpsE/sugar phosphate isomerase/epimerase